MSKSTFFVLSLSILQLSLGFELSLDIKNDTSHAAWKFPKNRQYHYFNSTLEIAPSFLPVKIDSLSERKGVWLLRQKDFLNLPDTFPGFDNQDDKRGSASINYLTAAIPFGTIRIKLFIVGDVTLTLSTNAFVDEIGHGHQHHPHEKEISLGGSHYKNCSKTDANATGPRSGFQWVIYDIQVMDGATKMELRPDINEPRSFILLDEIVIVYNEPAAPGATDVDDTYNWSEEKISKHAGDKDNEEDEPGPIKRKLYHVHCSTATDQ